jgi:predicted nucleotidyltransferase
LSSIIAFNLEGHVLSAIPQSHGQRSPPGVASGRQCRIASEAPVVTDPIAREFANLVRQRLGHRVKGLTLFGSRARGDAWDGSDYDVLVIVDDHSAEAHEAVIDVSVEMLDRHEALFSAVVRSEQEWRASQGFPLAANIAREGVDL